MYIYILLTHLHHSSRPAGRGRHVGQQHQRPVAEAAVLRGDGLVLMWVVGGWVCFWVVRVCVFVDVNVCMWVVRGVWVWHTGRQVGRNRQERLSTHDECTIYMHPSTRRIQVERFKTKTNTYIYRPNLHQPIDNPPAQQLVHHLRELVRAEVRQGRDGGLRHLCVVLELWVGGWVGGYVSPDRSMGLDDAGTCAIVVWV